MRSASSKTVRFAARTGRQELKYSNLFGDTTMGDSKLPSVTSHGQQAIPAWRCNFTPRVYFLISALKGRINPHSKHTQPINEKQFIKEFALHLKDRITRETSL